MRAGNQQEWQCNTGINIRPQSWLRDAESVPAFNCSVTPRLWWPLWDHLATRKWCCMPTLYSKDHIYVINWHEVRREKKMWKTYFLLNFCYSVSKITVKLQCFWKIVSYSKNLWIIFLSSFVWDVFMETSKADSHVFWLYFYSTLAISDHMV